MINNKRPKSLKVKKRNYLPGHLLGNKIMPIKGIA